MIIVRGLNVYSREVEEVLYHHPGVAEAAVIGVLDQSKGEVPKAFIVLKEGSRVMEVEILRFLRQRLANYKVPHYIEFRDMLPKSKVGKLLKREIRSEEQKRLEKGKWDEALGENA